MYNSYCKVPSGVIHTLPHGAPKDTWLEVGRKDFKEEEGKYYFVDCHEAKTTANLNTFQKDELILALGNAMLSTPFFKLEQLVWGQIPGLAKLHQFKKGDTDLGPWKVEHRTDTEIGLQCDAYGGVVGRLWLECGPEKIDGKLDEMDMVYIRLGSGSWPFGIKNQSELDKASFATRSVAKMHLWYNQALLYQIEKRFLFATGGGMNNRAAAAVLTPVVTERTPDHKRAT